MKQANRLAALARLVCAVFVLACFLLAAFEATHANHDHDHLLHEDECVQCLLLHRAAEGRRLLAGVCLCAVAAVLCFGVVRLLLQPKAAVHSATPVLLCDRMDS